MKYRDLKVWQRAMNLTERVYKATASFPEEEKFGLVAQLRRSMVSVPSNIAEGAGRNSSKQFVHFLNISRGSLNEAHTQLELVNRLNFLSNDIFSALEDEMIQISKMISVLLRRVAESSDVSEPEEMYLSDSENH